MSGCWGQRIRVKRPADYAAALRAVDELAAINQHELAESDAATYSDAAIRVGASRWAAEPGLPLDPIKASVGLGIVTTAGEPGETCVHLVDARHDVKNPLLKRCTYGIVWSASAVAHPEGSCDPLRCVLGGTGFGGGFREAVVQLGAHRLQRQGYDHLVPGFQVQGHHSDLQSVRTVGAGDRVLDTQEG